MFHFSNGPGVAHEVYDFVSQLVGLNKLVSRNVYISARLRHAVLCSLRNLKNNLQMLKDLGSGSRPEMVRGC